MTEIRVDETRKYVGNVKVDVRNFQEKEKQQTAEALLESILSLVEDSKDFAIHVNVYNTIKTGHGKG